MARYWIAGLSGAVVYLFLNGHVICWWFQPRFGCALTSSHWTFTLLSATSLLASLPFPKFRRMAVVLVLGMAIAWLTDQGTWALQNWYAQAYPAL